MEDLPHPALSRSTEKEGKTSNDERLTENPPARFAIGDDVAYIAPMAIFLGFTWLATKWSDGFATVYPIKTVCTAAALILLRRHYTRIRWNALGLGVFVGIIGTVQWIGLQLLLQKHFAFFRPSPDVFNPILYFHNVGLRWAFIAVRIAGASLVVPFMEELFWRDFLWRQILAPNDFKLARVGEWGWAPFLIVAMAFATVHGNWWLTAIVWALLVGLLLVKTKSLGACIVAHGTCTLLLAGYVLWTHDWSFW